MEAAFYNFLHKISLFNGLSDFREHIRRNRINCPLVIFFRTYDGWQDKVFR